MKRLADALNGIPIVFGTGLMLFIAVVVSANVIGRYVFNYGLVWSDEVARFSLIWISFLGSAVLVRQGQHIAIDAFDRIMPAALKSFIFIITQIVAAVVAVILIWQGILQVIRQFGQISPGLEINIGLVYTVVPFTGFYMLAYALLNMAERFKWVSSGDRPQWSK
jgi:TRAP-type C4-dicarboxylate transport system permease small subunit